MFDYAPRLQKAYTKIFDAPAKVAHEKLHLTPNQVSIVSFVITMIGLGMIGFKILEAGLIVMFVGVLLDALDGSMARKYNMQTKRGYYFELIFDGIHEVALFPVMAAAGYVEWRLALATLPAFVLLRIWTYLRWNTYNPGFKRVSPFFGYFFGFNYFLGVTLVWVYFGIILELLIKADTKFRKQEAQKGAA